MKFVEHGGFINEPTCLNCNPNLDSEIPTLMVMCFIDSVYGNVLFVMAMGSFQWLG